MFGKKQTRGMALLLSVAVLATTAAQAQAGSYRAGLIAPQGPVSGVILAAAGDDWSEDQERDAVGGGEGEEVLVDPMPIDDDGMVWIGGDPDFCEACGGEVIDGGEPFEGEPGAVGGGEGEGDVEIDIVDDSGMTDGEVTAVYDGEAIAMPISVPEPRGNGPEQRGAVARVGNGGAGGGSLDGCVVPQWRRDRAELCAGN